MSDGIQLSIKDSASSRLVGMLRKATTQAPKQSVKASEKMADDLVVFVKQFASGRPGPEVETGEYRDSIMKRGHQRSLFSSTTVVGTDKPQARRLEDGYVGIDRLGRHYHQPAFPHWRPGIRLLGLSKKKYAAILREALPK